MMQRENVTYIYLSDHGQTDYRAQHQPVFIFRLTFILGTACKYTGS